MTKSSILDGVPDTVLRYICRKQKSTTAFNKSKARAELPR